MKKPNSILTAFTLSMLVALTIAATLPQSALAEPECPGDGIVRTTSGSTATGPTCSDAIYNLFRQEWAKVDCPGNVSRDGGLVHNQCSWNGSQYVVMGWYEYQCQIDCYNPDFDPS